MANPAAAAQHQARGGDGAAGRPTGHGAPPRMLTKRVQQRNTHPVLGCLGACRRVSEMVDRAKRACNLGLAGFAPQRQLLPPLLPSKFISCHPQEASEQCRSH